MKKILRFWKGLHREFEDEKKLTLPIAKMVK